MMMYSPSVQAALIFLSINLPIAHAFLSSDTTGFTFFEGDAFGHARFVCSPIDDDAFFFPADDDSLSELQSDYLETICRSLDTFDNAVRFNRGSDSSKDTWKAKCDEFDPIDDLVCPTQDCIDHFCDVYNPLRPHLNPTVRKNYCEQFFGLLLDDKRRTQCTNHCVNYVSQDRGACCDWSCNDDANEEQVV
mmetsp:Transcript_19138/g.31730  ORF Transcript_19138/g.31730 Transcript_19138/m.31730 type:complete len:191 (-) Transcript_19138:33-605(-)